MSIRAIRRSRILSMTACVVAGLGLVLGAAVVPAQASTASRATATATKPEVKAVSKAAAANLPTTVTQDALPTVQINGIVWSQTTVGNTVYAVGNFSQARPAGAAAGTNQTPRANILAYNITTGVLNTSFVHTLNAQGIVVAASADGSTLYVGGDFTTVDGQTRNHIAAFSTATGNLLPFNPSVGGEVRAIDPTPNAVYIGGSFDEVNNAARADLAAVAPVGAATPGALLPWAPSANQIVDAIQMTPDGSKVFIGGRFDTINGVGDFGLAAVDPTSGAVIGTQVSTAIIAANGATSAGIWSLSTDGNLLYAASINAESAKFPQFEGTAAFDQSGNVVWVNDCWGDSYDAVPIGDALYVASHAHACEGPGWFPDLGSTHYYGLAYGLSPSAGYNAVDGRGWNYSAFHYSTLMNWTPQFSPGTVTGQSVWSFTGNSQYVAAGGEFPRVNKVGQQGLVRFAVHSLAPNAYGPSDIGAPTATISQTNSSVSVNVTVKSSYDPDDSYLTYTLIRNNDTANPVATTTALTPNFYSHQTNNVPNVTLTDPNPPAGSTATYQIFATDGGGKVNRSTPVTVNVPYVNLALNQPATQSSTLQNSSTYSASRADDGNVSTFDNTNADPNSWWQVDLGSSQNIGQVTVVNRQDCCQSRVSDYYVFVSNSPFNTSLTPAQQAAQSGVWSSHQTMQASTTGTAIPLPAGATGRYVMVQENTANQYLNLAEVQVNAPPVGYLSLSPNTISEGSVAVGQSGSQSFTLSNPGTTPITITSVTQPGSPFSVSPAITKGQTLAPFASVNETMTYSPTSPGSDTGTLSVTANDGRGAQTVSVTGATPGGAVNLALNTPSTQSSTLQNNQVYAAGQANDGNLNTFDNTNADPNSWWQTDLGVSGRIDKVIVTNRQDCCQSRVSDYYVFVSNAPFNTSLTPAQQATQSGVVAFHQTTQASASGTTITVPKGTTGRYVMVQQNTANQYLNLAEVSVIGPPPGKLTVSPTSLNFGTVAVGSSGTQTFTLSNPGTSSVSLTNYTGPSAPFSVSPAIAQGQTLAPGSSVTETVTYAPTAVNTDTGSIVLTANDGQGAQTVSLSGQTPGGAVNLALNKPATQSSTLQNNQLYAAGQANDGKTSTFDNTNADANSWWQVNLGSVDKVNQVVVTNRQDCCQSRVSDYYLFVSNTPFNTSLTPAQQAAQPGVWSSHQTTTASPSGTTIALPSGTTGQYVMIQENTQNQYLNLAEVGVIGPSQ